MASGAGPTGVGARGARAGGGRGSFFWQHGRSSFPTAWIARPGAGPVWWADVGPVCLHWVARFRGHLVQKYRGSEFCLGPSWIRPRGDGNGSGGGCFFSGCCSGRGAWSGAVLEGRQRVGAPVRSADWVVELRTGLEQGLLGGVLRALDPVSEEAYGLFLRAGQLSGTPGGVQRFLSNPEWRRVIGERRAGELQRDPVLMRQILEGRWMEVLRNPKVHGMLNDREVRRQLGAVDLEKALDYAVPKTEKGAARARPWRP